MRKSCDQSMPGAVQFQLPLRDEGEDFPPDGNTPVFAKSCFLFHFGVPLKRTE